MNLLYAMGARFEGFFSDFEHYIHVSATGRSNLFASIFGIFMLFLAYQLWRRKRMAIFVLSGFIMAAAAVDIVRGMGILPCLAGSIIAILLLSNTRAFPARPDPASFRKFKITLPVLTTVFFGYGIAGLYLMSDSMGLSRKLSSLTYNSVAVAVGEGHLQFHGWGVLYEYVLMVVGITSFIYLCRLLFGPHQGEEGVSEGEARRARELVAGYGGDSLSYFNLRHDKKLFFFSDRIFLAYRRVGGTAVISGDPVGPPELVGDIMESFRSLCRERGWRLCSIGSSEELVPHYRRAGLHCFALGEEAIVDLQGFSLEGRRVRKLRQSVNKLDRMGYTMDFMFNAGIPSHVRHELEEISAAWRGGKPETGFSMGLCRLMNTEDPDCLLAVAYGPGMDPMGFLYLAPMYPHEGYSLDVSRTRVDASNALTEFMLARTALFLKERRYRSMSLHFLALSQHYRDDRTNPGNSKWKFVAKVLDTFLPVVSQYYFDRKFHPQWKKRYIVYESLADFPGIGMAVMTAESALKVTRPNYRNNL